MNYEDHAFLLILSKNPQCACPPEQTDRMFGANAALSVRGVPPPPTPPRRVPACGDSHPCPDGLSPQAGTLGRGGVTPLDPESPHGYWQLQNRAAFADSGVATPALVAPHPCIDLRYDMLVIPWRFMAVQWATDERLKAKS
jgi:hypothetical protein